MAIISKVLEAVVYKSLFVGSDKIVVGQQKYLAFSFQIFYSKVSQNGGDGLGVFDKISTDAQVPKPSCRVLQCTSTVFDVDDLSVEDVGFCDEK